ncbi:MAG: hypothetical protein R3F37_03525 [Candidatus Competibacteraceae bacterium]
MDFNNFLAELQQVLASQVITDQLKEPIPKVTFDPTRKQAGEPNQIFIGVGYWMLDDTPVKHQGVCLNINGTVQRFGPAHQYSSVTDLVLDPPQELSQFWQAATVGAQSPMALLSRFELVVEDVGPDSCFALLCWLALCCGVPAAELRQGRGKAWVEAVRRWKSTGMAENHFAAWPALLSALGHSYISPASENAKRSPDTLSRAWNETLAFTVALLRRDIDPDDVPSLPDLDTYVRAKAFMNIEYQDYRDSLPNALKLQLLIPLRGTGDARQLLVDAYFAVETWPSGTKKLFIRTDKKHTHLGQGFALMGLYRPNERGSGNDITVTVNPQIGIYLKALWEELERLEIERWQGERPQEHPRPIASYGGTAGYSEP